MTRNELLQVVKEAFGIPQARFSSNHPIALTRSPGHANRARARRRIRRAPFSHEHL
jgi:hypothetical protein